MWGSGGERLALKDAPDDRKMRDKVQRNLLPDPPDIAMTAPAFDLATTVRHPPDSAVLQAADHAVAAALESALADSTNRVYRTQWRSFSSWCSDVGLRPLPADPLTVARYLGVRGEAGVSMATLRQAVSAITRVHEWIGQPSPCQDTGAWGNR